MSGEGKSAFFGDISPKDAYNLLSQEPDAVLVDVRTHAELAFVGAPDLTDLGDRFRHIEWRSYPGGQDNPSFLSDLSSVVQATGCSQVLFLCRSGVRSLHAAHAAEGLAVSKPLKLYNIAGGFEGDPDSEGRRGRLAGWKVDGLPWRQN